MKQILFFILVFAGANYLPMKLIKDILTELKKSTNEIQTSVDQVNASVAQNMKYIYDLHNQSSSNSKIFEHKFDEMQKKQEKTEQLIDQKYASISEALQKSALNTQKLQDSMDQLSADINDLHYQSSSKSNLFESILYELQKTLERTEQIIDQKLAIISEDLQKSALNTKKLQDYVDQLSIEHSETSSMLMALDNNLNDLQETEKLLEQNIVANSEDHQKLGHQLDTILKLHLTDCSDLYYVGLNVSTSYFLQKYNREVLCNMETDSGGWLVIQKRQNVTKQVDFNTTWSSYKEGFGDLNTEFWIGNEFLHQVTNKKSYELLINMEDFENGTFYASYSEFRVGNKESGYQLHVGGYEGNVYDSLEEHNNMKFTTFDRDNDGAVVNCAKEYSGGFWYNSCYEAHLTGVFPTNPDRGSLSLITWWLNGEYLILINVEMKIRPKQ